MRKILSWVLLAIGSSILGLLVEIITEPGLKELIHTPANTVRDLLATLSDQPLTLNEVVANAVVIAISLWIVYSILRKLQRLYGYAAMGLRIGHDARRSGFNRSITAHPLDSKVADDRDDETKERDRIALVANRVEGLRKGNWAKLILASGYADIGRSGEKGPLYDHLARPHGIQILILDPRSEAAKNRERWLHNEGVTQNGLDYRNGIVEVLRNLQRLSMSSPCNIEVGLYEQRPTFRLLLTDEIVLVQGMNPRLHSGQTTMVWFDSGDHSLYHIFVELFDKKWEESIPLPMDVDPKEGLGL